MTEERLLKEWLYEEAAAEIHGWDFSHIADRYREYPLPWDYRKIIEKYLKSSDRLLDIDTGGGEFLDSLGHPEKLTYATEGYMPNVRLCREKYENTDVSFTEMGDYRNMPFCDEYFDVVINRHGTYDAGEIYRVLKSGGIFITQQVGEDNDRELVEMLLPDCKRQFLGHRLDCRKKLFEDKGFKTLECDEAFVPIEFYDSGALVWFAKIIEWEFCGFSVKECLRQLTEVQRRIEKYGKVSGLAHRFYMVMQK